MMMALMIACALAEALRAYCRRGKAIRRIWWHQRPAGITATESMVVKHEPGRGETGGERGKSGRVGRDSGGVGTTPGALDAGQRMESEEETSAGHALSSGRAG